MPDISVCLVNKLIFHMQPIQIDAVIKIDFFSNIQVSFSLVSSKSGGLPLANAVSSLLHWPDYFFFFKPFRCRPISRGCGVLTFLVISFYREADFGRQEPGESRNE